MECSSIVTSAFLERTLMDSSSKELSEGDLPPVLGPVDLTPKYWPLLMRVVAWWLRKEHLMPRQYPPHFRRDMVNRMVAGESVLSLVEETSVPEQTLHRWKHQALIDAGVKDGLDSQESAELRSLRKRIRVLEQELQLVKDASELFDAQAVVPPKGGRPLQKDS